MGKPDAIHLAAAIVYLFVAAVCGSFLPRLARLARRYPATRRAVLAWRLLCGVLLVAVVTELLGTAAWVTLTVHGAGVTAAVVVLWPHRHDVAAVLRGRPAPSAAQPVAPAARTWPSRTGDGVGVVTSVEDARALYGPDPTGSATGGYRPPEPAGERSPDAGDDQDV